MKVTCLCLTRNRREWLPKAIACFLKQDYEDKELLIVADGEPVSDLVTEEYCAGHRDWRTTIALIRCPEGLTLGAKRNFGCEHAIGSIIAHWDDDDYSAPGRLADQVDRLKESDLDVTGYHTLLYRDYVDTRIVEAGGLRKPSGWWRWRSQDGAAAGTSLCYRRLWWHKHPFEDVHGGEDDRFWSEAMRHNAAIASDGRDLMYATNHAGSFTKRVAGGIEWEELLGSPYAAA